MAESIVSRTPNPEDITLTVIDSSLQSFRCGHSAASEFSFTLWGANLCLAEAADKNEQCGDCHLKHLRDTSIRCAKCGLPILAGDFVCCWLHEDLMDNPNAAFGVKTKHYRGGDEIYLGCMRTDCCFDAHSFTGCWDGRNLVSAKETRTS